MPIPPPIHMMPDSQGLASALLGAGPAATVSKTTQHTRSSERGTASPQAQPGWVATGQRLLAAWSPSQHSKDNNKTNAKCMQSTLAHTCAGRRTASGRAHARRGRGARRGGGRDDVGVVAAHEVVPTAAACCSSTVYSGRASLTPARPRHHPDCRPFHIALCLPV